MSVHPFDMGEMPSFRRGRKKRPELHLDETRDNPGVDILGRDGRPMQRRLGTLIEDGSRCRVKWEGEWHDAVRLDGRWVHNPYEGEQEAA